MYVKIKNNAVEKFPYSFADLRADNPDVSFPANITDSLFANFGALPVQELSVPEVDKTKYAVKKQLPELTDGAWVLGWDVIEKNAENLAEEETQEAENMRASRSKKLTFCDWTQLPDAPLTAEKKQEWAFYRQQLRDITSQSGFPWEVIWPTKPE